VGDRVDTSTLTAGRKEEVRRRLEKSVAALAAMVDGGCFTGHEDTAGMEVELDLVDPLGRPRLVNDAVLERLGRPDLQHELGRFNIEVNLPPQRLATDALRTFERQLAALLGIGETEVLGVRLAAIGILPTLGAEQLTRERLSSPTRYAVLAQRMRAERHGPVVVRIAGRESLAFSTDSIAPEAAATSLQLHLRVPPERFAAYYNAAQAMAGAQIAAGANSPYLLGRELWHETRVALCEQVLYTRQRREVRPACHRGRGWATAGCTGRWSSSTRSSSRCRRCCRRSPPRTRSTAWPPARSHDCTNSGCTTARCGGGTGRSTTPATATRTFASRTGYCPADRRPST